MKYPVCSLLFCLLGLLCRPQNPPSGTGSKAGTDKPPTQAEFQEMMKAFQNLSEEDKKMLEQMGVRIPDLKDIPNMSAQDFAGAWDDEDRLVPVRDAKRIASIPRKVSGPEMGEYIRTIQVKLAEILEPETVDAARASVRYFQGLTGDREEMGNMAMGLFISGKPKLALFTLGELLSSDPQIEISTNDNHLSNYAAMLSMHGGEHLAIPVLNHLNVKYKGNSTILNNLGQAWFGLGEINKASTYLDSVLTIFPGHGQANLTKSVIEESKGNTGKAVELIRKSIKEGYSREKEERLEKLGEKLTLKDLHVPFKPGPDPLSLSNLHRPNYPTNLSELRRLKPIWESFNEECSARIVKYQKELSERTEQYARDLKKMTTSFSQKPVKGSTPIPIYSLNLYAKKATLAMTEAKTYHDGKMALFADQYTVLAQDLEAIRRNHPRAVSEAPCEDHVAAENSFLASYNERKRIFDEEALDIYRHYLNDMGYWSQFTSMNENQFDIIRLGFLIEWLQKNLEYQPLLYSEFELMECIEDEDEEFTKLSEFDLVACRYKSKIDLIVVKFENNCSRMTSTLDLKFIEYTRYDNFERAIGDEYVSSKIKISAEEAIGTKNYGPLKAELKVGIGLELEMDREGVKDITAIGELKAGAGVGAFDEYIEKEGASIAGKDIVDTTKEFGVEGRISLISGHGSIQTSSSYEALKGIILAEW